MFTKPPATGHASRRTKFVGIRIVRIFVVLPILCSDALAQGWDDFHFGSIFGETLLRLEVWDEQRTSANSDVGQQEVVAREEVTVGTIGYFYHPRFITFDLRGTLGLQQQWTFVDGPTSDRTSDALFPNWDMRADLFKENAYSGSLYSTRAETWTRQSLFPTTRSTVTETGTNIHANEWRIPSRLHYHRYEFDSHGGSSQDMVRDNVLLKGSEFGDNKQIQYGLEYNRTQQGSNVLNYEDYNGYVSTTNYFGEMRDLRWINNARLRSQVGDVEVDSTRASSQLFKRWSPDLTTNIAARFDRTTSESQSNETANMSVGLSHQLYDSLTSTLSLQTSATKLNGGDIGVLGGGSQLVYRKETPIGRLGLRYEADYYLQDQDDLGGIVAVFDEAQLFTLGVPILLRNHNVEMASVVITDSAGLVFYTQGADYFLSMQGSQLRIDIPVGSLINPGETLLVDYSFAPNPEIEFSDLAQRSSFSFDFNRKADINLSYATVDQTLHSGVDSGILSDSRRTSAGANVHPWGLTLGALYEDFESEFAPFERTTLLGSYQGRIGKRSHGRIGVNTFTTKFDGEAENEKGTSASLTVNSGLGDGSLVEFWAEWHKIHYRTDEGNGFGVELSWKRKIRAMGLAVRLRHVEEEFSIASDQRITSLTFTVSRSF